MSVCPTYICVIVMKYNYTIGAKSIKLDDCGALEMVAIADER